MSNIDSIKKPIANELKEFDAFFNSCFKTNVPLLDIILKYIIKTKGKQLRPMLVFLSAKLTGEISKPTYIAGALVELLHTATLIHDDVVDDSFERRGKYSIKALWKSKVAVLVGDYLLSKGLLLAIDNEQFELLKIVSTAVREMAEGELHQIQKSRKLDITEDEYFEIVRKKTATLISACTACGAKSTGGSDEDVKVMAQYGEYLGIAFQIKDDLFDYEKSNNTGKPTGNDIKEKKFTLPLIHALQKSEPKEKRKIIGIIKSKKDSKSNITTVQEFVKKYNGIEYAQNIMSNYYSQAINLINKFEDSKTKESLKLLSKYVIERKK